MNKHETDVFSLIFGVAFLLAAVTWLVAKTADISWLSIGWVIACGLVLLGLLGLFSAIRPQRSR